ncbi:hypothetical protein FOZ60_014037 [Perkinsus olseni]|uniref:Uncharacterized protein n=2 Tax=Perkinsus olseni TaxID=32597 RepID=A0A7J6N869_PEROL|nr:hypothetical protein FOZ60_014037 [Perkinsus olseni]
MRNPNTTTGTSWANHDASEARRLSELVDARKRSEQDAELLSNRIALLRAEGIRTEKRIAEARRRAEELINAKRKSAEAKIQRANKDDSEYKRLELIRMRACEQREGARNRIKEKLEWVQDSKMKLYKKARDDRIAVIELKGRQHAEAMRAAQERRKYVRRSHNKAAEARMKLVEDRQIQRRAEMEERCRREEAMMKVKEEEIDSMERVEKCLIRRLQDSQKRQRETYRYLQDILEVLREAVYIGPDDAHLGSPFILPSWLIPYFHNRWWQ